MKVMDPPPRCSGDDNGAGAAARGSLPPFTPYKFYMKFTAYCLLPTAYFPIFSSAKIFNKDIVMAKIAILGYGNLGRGVECAVKQAPDMELVAVFTRRDPATVKIQTAGVPVLNVSEMEAWKDKVDLLIICGGSATDLPVLTPKYASMFNVIDSFDTHAKIPQHFAAVDAAAESAGIIAMISVGWDPGMFSLNRVYAQSILPEGKDYTFWGKGDSQGHSDAVRRIKGVKHAKKYTCPVE